MDQACEKCSGEGVKTIVSPDGDERKNKLIECECAILKRLAFSMPPEVRIAKVTKAHAVHPITQMMDRSIFVSAHYADVLALLKVAIYKNNGRHVRMTSDAVIRNVGVGSMSRKSKGEDARGDVFNDFNDLMETPPLVVVWLNRLGHKNVAAAGFLIEALTVRLDKRRPTWVISDKDRPFGPGSIAHSDAVWSFLHMAFQKIDIPRILDFSSANSSGESPIDVEYVKSQQIEADKPKPPERQYSKKKSWPKPSDDEDIPEALRGIGAGAKRSDKFRGRE